MIIESWQHRVNVHSQALVLPDGCRDFIVVHREDSAPQAFVSPLDKKPRQVSLQAGCTLTGFRLPAAALPDEQQLCQTLANRLAQPDCLPQALQALVRGDDALTEALLAISAGASTSVAAVCVHLGVSERSLQRLFSRCGKPPPLFWLRLARVRAAAGALLTGRASVAVAADFGYADQSHLTRECRHWLGCSAGAINRDCELASLLYPVAQA